MRQIVSGSTICLLAFKLLGFQSGDRNVFGEEDDFCISSWFLMDHSGCLVVVSDIWHSSL